MIRTLGMLGLAALLTGCEGAVGPRGEQGPIGPAGSPDTAAEVLAKLQQVDGAGSGLDADLLGGAASTEYSRSRTGSIPLTPHAMRLSGGATIGDRGPIMNGSGMYIGYTIVLPEDFVSDGDLSLTAWWKTNDASACNYQVSQSSCLHIAGPTLGSCTWTSEDGSFDVSSAGGDTAVNGFVQKRYLIQAGGSATFEPGDRVEIMFTRGAGTCASGVIFAGGNFSYPRQ